MITTKTIEQTVTFRASPHDVFEALMDSGKHSHFTGAQANISRQVGGPFTAYEGALSGTILELVKVCSRSKIADPHLLRTKWTPLWGPPGY